jgi:hypothetical protein
MSAFAALLGTGKPVFTTGIMCKVKTAFPIFRFFVDLFSKMRYILGLFDNC